MEGIRRAPINNYHLDALSEQIGMASCAEQIEFGVFGDLIDQEPVWLYMTFMEEIKIAGELMIFVPGGEFLPVSEHVDDVLEETEIKAALWDGLEILAELV